MIVSRAGIAGTRGDNGLAANATGGIGDMGCNDAARSGGGRDDAQATPDIAFPGASIVCAAKPALLAMRTRGAREPAPEEVADTPLAARHCPYWRLIAFIGLLFPLGYQPARADTSSGLSAAFTQMIAEPGNANAAITYARLAAANGQPRAAIAALERLLRIDPRLDTIRLELASLYLSVGASDLAALYAKQALTAPDIPPDVAERARQLLAQAEAGSSHSLLQFSLFGGFRHDTDANQATSFGTVSAFAPGIGIVPITPGVRAQPSWSSVITGQFYHRYDLGLQTEGAWETSGNIYDQRFFSVSHWYDLTALQVDTGPRFGVGKIGDFTVTVRPYISVAWLVYGMQTYASFYGGGVATEMRANRLTIALSGQGRYGNYNNSSFRPVSRPYTGPEFSFSGVATYVLTTKTTLSANISFYDASGQLERFSRQGPGAGVAVTQEISLFNRPIELAARAAIQFLQYGAPDPLIDPVKRRSDTLIDAGLSVTAPIARMAAVVLQYGYFRNNSSYRIYTFDNHAVTIGVKVRL